MNQFEIEKLRLVKSCESQYNIAKRCKTIKLGTIDEYRRMNSNFSIADKFEGIGSVFDSVSGNVMNDCQIVPNSYVYCLSIEEPDKIIKPEEVEKSYDSKLYIKDNRSFVQYLDELFRQQFTLDDLSPLDKHRIQMYPDWRTQKLDFHTIGEPIRYNDFKFYESSVPNVDINTIIEVALTKPTLHTGNNEFRILFLVVHPKLGILQVKNRPKYLRSDLFSQFVEVG
jgi:hypothetical protein